jgi:hypothetical protein
MVESEVLYFKQENETNIVKWGKWESILVSLRTGQLCDRYLGADIHANTI